MSLLNHQARTATSSGIRDLLEHAQRPGMISLAGGLPDPTRFPMEALADIAAAVVRADDGAALQYGLTAGMLELRQHIVATTPEAADTGNVIITTGSQQALHLLSQVLLEPGRTVVVADPDYLGATQAFRSAGAELTAIPIDEDGLRVDELEQRLRTGLRPTFAYLVPHFHNPSGATLSAERRQRLLELADEYGFLVVFDDPYRDLYVEGAAPPTDLDPHPMAVHLRSTSKILAPGLRVGWMIAPDWLTAAVERAKQSADLHTSTVSQAIVLAALQSAWLPEHLDELQRATRTKRDALCDELERTLDAAASFTRPRGGMFAWVRLDASRPTDELLALALDEGVAFVPGSAFAVDRDLSAYLRLSWATATPDELREGIARLGRAIDC